MQTVESTSSTALYKLWHCDYNNDPFDECSQCHSDWIQDLFHRQNDMLSSIHLATNWTLSLYTTKAQGSFEERGAKNERNRRWEDQNKAVSSGSDRSVPLVNSLHCLYDPQKSNLVIILTRGGGLQSWGTMDLCLFLEA